MNFVLVNDGQPSHESPCGACARPLRSGYVRHVATRECYCDYECYRQHQLGAALMSWPFSAAQDSIDVKERCRVSTAGGRGDRHVELHGLLELHHTHVGGIAITDPGVSVGPRVDDLGRR